MHGTTLEGKLDEAWDKVKNSQAAGKMKNSKAVSKMKNSQLLSKMKNSQMVIKIVSKMKGNRTKVYEANVKYEGGK